jgi:hypothetical protein
MSRAGRLDVLEHGCTASVLADELAKGDTFAKSNYAAGQWPVIVFMVEVSRGG